MAGRLSDGLPVIFVAALAALVLVAILFTVATREPKEARGYAEFTLFRQACLIHPLHSSNAMGCEYVSPGLYRVRFTKSLAGSTVVASRATGSGGQVSASIAGRASQAVLVAIEPRLRRPVVASVLVP
jgi:hypothetical protein